MAYTLQLKRHVNYASKEEALNGLKDYLATAAVGEPAIATYGRGSGSADIENDKVLFGIKGSKGYTIFDYEAIPADVKAALDAIKGNGYDKDGTYATLKAIADALTIINGADTVEGSIAKAKQEAKDYADGQINKAVQALDVTDAAVAKSFVTKVSETDGKIAVERGAITSKDKTVVIGDGVDGGFIDLKANVDGSTIVINKETGVMSVASAALVQYVGQDAIAVSGEAEGEKKISLKLDTADKVLAQTPNGLLANIGLTWSNTDGLKLTGNNSEVIATVPATDFIKDGMLQNVELKVATTKAPIANKTSGTFLVFTFNTDAGDKVINLDVTSLIDVYIAGDGISVSGKVIAAKLDGSTEGFLTVSPNGIKLSGVQSAIDTAKNEVQGKLNAEITRATQAEETNKAAIGVNTAAIAKLNGDKTTTGSVAKAVADAKAELLGDAATEYNTLGKLEDKIQALDVKATKAHTEVVEKTDGHVRVAVTDSTDGTHKVVTVSENDIASANALTSEITRAKGAEDKIEASVGLAADGSHAKTTGNYTKDATTVVGEIAALDTQVKKNADAIAAEKTRATGEEKRITDTVIGVSKLGAGKSVMDVILENEETAQQAIEQLATAAGVLSGEQIKYTAPTKSGVFSSTTSIMDMLNTIDEKWNTIDCGEYN